MEKEKAEDENRMDKQVLNKVDGVISVLCDLSCERFKSIHTDRVIALTEAIGKLLAAREALEGANPGEGLQINSGSTGSPVGSIAETGGAAGEQEQKTDPHNGAETPEILSVRLRRLQKHLWDVLETDPRNEEVIHSLSSSMDSLIKRYHSMGINAGKTDGR